MLIITSLLVAASMLNQACYRNADMSPFSVTRAIKNTFLSHWTGSGQVFYVNNGVFARVEIRIVRMQPIYDQKDNLLSIKLSDALVSLQFGTEVFNHQFFKYLKKY